MMGTRTWRAFLLLSFVDVMYTFAIKSNSSENVQQQGQNASKLTVSYTELCKFCLLTCLRLVAFRQLAI